MFFAGMLLTCWVKIHEPGTYGAFVKDVPVKVLHVGKDGDVMVEYDFAKAPGIYFIGDKPIKDIVTVEDLKSSTYMRCKDAK